MGGDESAGVDTCKEVEDLEKAAGLMLSQCIPKLEITLTTAE